MLHVASLHIYPVKACRGVDLQTMTLDGRGPVGDRRFMVVDEGGRFISQREAPTLAQVSARLTAEGMVLDTATLPAITVTPSERRLPVSVWSSDLEALDAGDEPAEWLSEHLGRPARLVQMAEDVIRPIDPQFAGAETSVAFADGFPLLVTHASSVAELNQRLDVPVTMERFRPNLVLAGGEPWAEDGWRQLTVGAVRIELVKPCERCKVLNVDPRTGEVGGEPLRTLATYRRLTGGLVVFGQNAVHTGPGTIRLGDPVHWS